MIPDIFITPLLITFGILNGVTFALFWFDKWMAATGGWRVPEAALWIFSAIGGSIGGLMAMHLLRHKTKKSSFQLVMAAIIIVQCLCIYAAFSYTKGGL